MIWDLIFSDHGYFVFQQESKQQQALDDEIRALRTEEVRLKAEIIRLRENPKALEEVIHRELGYVYPDEFMLIMPETEEAKIAEQKIEKEEE